ncbi:hypothetical protein ABMA28_000231 [Loxostege sticticalis]|uniref:FLYWCH-type domain-containing protein n=1 Tax=Loxostege sticticalis TaxID=481309 RepID=A0ABD0TRH2_LOXSC
MQKNKSTLHFNKISALHVKPKFRSKMKVKLAAQILSNTVSAILKLLSEKYGETEKGQEMLETAIVIVNLDRLFDCTNGPSSAKDMACEPSCNQVNISADFTIIPSQRGGDLLIFNGYRYSKRRLNKNGHVVWRCGRRKICKASLITHQQALIKNEKHSCTSNEVIMKLKLEYRCIDRAVKETTPIPSIYSEVVEEFNNAGYDLVEQMPSFDIMKKVLYRRRHQALQTNKTRFL